jgi:glycosyltransferase involved in cell wall biosynthesis
MVVGLSVIIPCYGSSVVLEKCLQMLGSQVTQVKYEIILVDSSPDNQVEMILKNFPNVRFVYSQQRLMPGAARNLGVRNAYGERLAFLDSDCIPSPHWMEQAMTDIPPGCPMMGGPVLDDEDARPIEWVDNRLQFADFQAGRPSGAILHMPSCNMVLSLAAFKALGGFREDIITGEDVLFTLRLKELNMGEIWFNPNLVIYHYGRRKWNGFIEHQKSLGYYRGWLDLMVNRTIRKMGIHPVLKWLLVIRRLAYIYLRIFQFDKRSIFRSILYFPLIVCGLIAWTIGFNLGVRQRNAEL